MHFKTYRILATIFFISIFSLSFLVHIDQVCAVGLKHMETINLTPRGDLELRPEIHVVKRQGKERIFVVMRKLNTPFLVREFFFNTRQQGPSIPLFPVNGERGMMITDFGSLFEGKDFYLTALAGERGQGRPAKNMRQGGGFFQRRQGGGSSRGRGRGRSEMSMKLYLNRYDQNFQITDSVIVLEEQMHKEHQLITGGPEADTIVLEQGDDPGIVSDGENIYLITELRKRGRFGPDDPQYRVRVFDKRLNNLLTRDIPAPGFSGGFHKLVYPVYHHNRFLLLGEFVPDGFGDPDLPPALRARQPNQLNKDLFVISYDRGWNLFNKGKRLTDTFPGIEYYATNFLPYKSFYFAAYSFASGLDNKQRGRLGDGELHISVFNANFKRTAEYVVSRGVSAQGSLAVYKNHLISVHSEKEIPDIPHIQRVKGGFKPKKADVIMNIYQIVR